MSARTGLTNQTLTKHLKDLTKSGILTKRLDETRTLVVYDFEQDDLKDIVEWGIGQAERARKFEAWVKELEKIAISTEARIKAKWKVIEDFADEATQKSE